jgi:hypothetical protein
VSSSQRYAHTARSIGRPHGGFSTSRGSIRFLAIETFRQAWGRPIDCPPVDDIFADLNID